MRLIIGLVLTLLGTAILLYGIGDALLDLIGLYQTALNTPLDAPPDYEQHVSHAMLVSVAIGAIGIPPLLIGSYLFYSTLRRQHRERQRRRGARSAPGAGGW